MNGLGLVAVDHSDDIVVLRFCMESALLRLVKNAVYTYGSHSRPICNGRVWPQKHHEVGEVCDANAKVRGGRFLPLVLEIEAVGSDDRKSWNETCVITRGTDNYVDRMLLSQIIETSICIE